MSKTITWQVVWKLFNYCLKPRENAKRKICDHCSIIRSGINNELVSNEIHEGLRITPLSNLMDNVAVRARRSLLTFKRSLLPVYRRGPERCSLERTSSRGPGTLQLSEHESHASRVHLSLFFFERDAAVTHGAASR